MSVEYPAPEEGLMIGCGRVPEEGAFYGDVRLTGALAISEPLQARLLADIVEGMRQKYPDLGAEAAAVRKILSEPWCPDGVLARIAAWNMNKRNILRRACDRLGLPHAGLSVEINGC